MKVQKLLDGSQARKYLLYRLSPGYQVATKLLQKRGDFALGSFFVVVPDSVDADQLSDFGSEIPGVDPSDATQILSKIVKRFTRNPNCTVLLHDFVNSASDPGWKEYEYKDRATFYNDELCWELKGPDSPQSEIEELISHWSAYFPVSAFLCASSLSGRKEHLADADLEDMANNLIAVAVDIFDGDSFAIWWREDLIPFPAL